MNKHNKNKKGKKLIATNNKKTHIIVPIIAMLILISFITTIVVGIHLTNNNNQQIAEVKNEEEEIKAAESIRLIGEGGTYTAPRDGIYRIELHGGRGGNEGNHGDMVTGFVSLKENSVLDIAYMRTKTYGGEAVSVFSGDTLLAGAGGGTAVQGLTLPSTVDIFCYGCRGYHTVAVKGLSAIKDGKVYVKYGPGHCSAGSTTWWDGRFDGN